MKVESRNLGLLTKGTCPVPEVTEEEEGEDVSDSLFKAARVSDFADNVDDELEESKTMKEFIDLELQANTKKPSSNRKDFKEFAGSFWVAASVFSKKLRKWRKKQGTKRDTHTSGCNADRCGAGLGEMRLDRLRGRRLRDTQSEVGEYGFGRRSCDTDPRGSLDFGRASIDCGAFGRRSCDTDPRFSIDLGRASVDCDRIAVDEGRGSFDAPRASWDGYLLGGRTLPGGAAPVVSVIENAMATVYGFDHRMLAERKMKVENGDKRDSSGFNRMKDQYLDGASVHNRRRKGFDRSHSLKRDVVVTDDGEAKLLSNARVSPATIGIFDGAKLLITEKELNEWRLNSTKDDSSESFETASKDLASVSSSSNGKSFKKCRQWSKLWGIWGLLHKKKGDKCGNEEKVERGNGECLHARNSTVEARPDPDWELVRSHSTASSRGSSTVVGSTHRTLSRTESKALVLDRNRSARFSPNHFDNGMLRFYLTPLRSRRRSKLGKSRLKNSHSLARSVLRL